MLVRDRTGPKESIYTPPTEFPPPETTQQIIETKSRGVATLLALFLGGIGGHKFYLGKPMSGLIYLVFIWTLIPSILGLIDPRDASSAS